MRTVAPQAWTIGPDFFYFFLQERWALLNPQRHPPESSWGNPFATVTPGFRHEEVCEGKNTLSFVLIDLLMDLFGGAVSPWGVAGKQPICLNRAFSLLNGPFSDLNGRLPYWAVSLFKLP